MHQPAHSVTISQAARLLKISTSTVQRLCTQGALSYVETPGGHRRVQLSGLNVLLQRTRGGPLPGHRAEPPACLSHQQLVELLLAGRDLAILDWLSRDCPRPDQLVKKLEDDLYAAIVELDVRFLAGELNQAQIWLALATVRGALDRLAVRLEPNRPERLAVGGAPGDCHDSLGLRFVQIGLRICGLKPVNLGGDLSPELLASIVVKLDSKLVWLSHTHVGESTQLIRWHTRLAALLPSQVRILVGGGGLSPNVRRRLPAHTFYESLASMIEGELPSAEWPSATWTRPCA